MRTLQSNKNIGEKIYWLLDINKKQKITIFSFINIFKSVHVRHVKCCIYIGHKNSNTLKTSKAPNKNCFTLSASLTKSHCAQLFANIPSIQKHFYTRKVQLVLYPITKRDIRKESVVLYSYYTQNVVTKNAILVATLTYILHPLQVPMQIIDYRFALLHSFRECNLACTTNFMVFNAKTSENQLYCSYFNFV